MLESIWKGYKKIQRKLRGSFMEKDLQERLERYKIDREIRPLIALLWAKGYETNYSCSGHGVHSAYISYDANSGNGWFERNAHKFGLSLRGDENCKHLVREKDKCCPRCGAGLNRNVVYSGKLKIPLVLR